MKNFNVQRHSRSIVTMGAAALVLAAQTSIAQPQTPGQNSSENWNLGFDYLDANQDQALSREELESGYDLSNGQSDSQPAANGGEDGFAEYDQNQDQSLDEEEYQSFASDPQYQSQRKTPYAADWQQMFNDVDENANNGAEWTELQQAYQPQLSELGWDKQNVLQRFDANNDGTLDENEYVFFMTGLEAQYQQNVAGNSGQQDRISSSTGMQQQESNTTQSAGQQSSESQKSGESLTQNESQSQIQDEELTQSPDQNQMEESAIRAGAAASGQQNQRDQQAQAQGQQNQESQSQGQQEQLTQQNQSDQQSQQNQSTDPALVTTLITVTAVEPVAIEEIEGNEVYNLEGQEIGNVSDVVTDTAQQQTGLVVSVGGFLGVGDKNILVPMEEVQLSEDRVVWQTLADEETLDNLPEYNSQDYISVR